MTRVQKRATLLIAAFVLAIGCALAIGMTQQAHAAVPKLAGGSTIEKATVLNYAADKKNLDITRRSEFNGNADNCHYKFTTSDRDSRYKLKVASSQGYLIYITIRDAGQHRIALMSTASKTGKTWVFKNLKRNAVYYIELWRFVSSGADYIDSGTVLDTGLAETVYPPYKIYLKELITKPTVTGFVATSKSDHMLNLKWKEPSYNTETIQIQFWWSWQSKRTKNNTFWRTESFYNHYNTKVKYNGTSKPYKVRIRPYRTVNNKKYYGKWTGWKTVIIK